MSITAAQVAARVADALARSVDSLDSRWFAFADRGFAAATAAVHGALLGRGFARAQVGLWDRLDEVTLDLATFYALSYGAALAGVTPEQLAIYDRREELASIPLTAGDGSVLLVPPPDAPATAGGIGGGQMSRESWAYAAGDPFDRPTGEVYPWR